MVCSFTFTSFKINVERGCLFENNCKCHHLISKMYCSCSLLCKRFSHRPGEMHVKRKSLCNKMCGSWQESRGCWYMQQKQPFRLQKQNFYSDAQRRFYHGARRSRRAGSFSRFGQVPYSIGTIKYCRLIIQFSCFILKVRKFRSLSGQSVLTY